MPQTVSRTLTEDQIAQFQSLGYLVIRRLFGPDEITELRETFMAQTAEGPVPGLSEIGSYSADDPLSRYPRIMHPHRHPEFPVGPIAMARMLDRRVEDILGDLFGEEPLAAQSMFYFKPAGARGQDLHQDNFYLRVSPGTCIAAWTAVDDADEENGTLVVVPGSNRGPVYCPQTADSTIFFTTEHVDVPQGMKEVPVRLRAGDVLFFNGSLIHGSYPNTSTDRFRRAFICHYIPASSREMSHWYRPLLSFDGSEVEVADAEGGGPCGTAHDATAPH